MSEVVGEDVRADRTEGMAAVQVIGNQGDPGDGQIGADEIGQRVQSGEWIFGFVLVWHACSCSWFRL
ncbi:hypothetical protein B1H26_21735 [Amycolatopsis sp. BJA-103]|nr:hypothetical protein BKN51_12805 [Amycolatopsis sp. BJA-103]PNE17545.1 hypothetical protein B1H26_21735 [Amycolatopsis sp. BJA-103]